MKIDTSKVTRVEIIDHQSEPTIGSGNFAKPMLCAVVGSQTKYQIVYADPAWDFGDRK